MAGTNCQVHQSLVKGLGSGLRPGLRPFCPLQPGPYSCHLASLRSTTLHSLLWGLLGASSQPGLNASQEPIYILPSHTT